MILKKTCLCCGKEFSLHLPENYKRKTRDFCSYDSPCRKKLERAKKGIVLNDAICIRCGAPFHKKQGNQKTCGCSKVAASLIRVWREFKEGEAYQLLTKSDEPRPDCTRNCIWGSRGVCIMPSCNNGSNFQRGAVKE